MINSRKVFPFWEDQHFVFIHDAIRFLGVLTSASEIEFYFAKALSSIHKKGGRQPEFKSCPMLPQ